MDTKVPGSATQKGSLPPGQFLTEKFPVLTYGGTPAVNLGTWRLEIRGLVEEAVRLTWEEFRALPTIQVSADFHCVTGWSRLNNSWEGVRVRDLIYRARPRPGVGYVIAHSYGGYTTNLALQTLLEDDVLIAFRHDGRDLDPDHGGPARLVVPSRYGWKSAKWVQSLELVKEDARGFWEMHGYHSNADPWTEERYAS